MAVDIRKKRAAALAARGIKDYGELAAVSGFSGFKSKYYSTGSPTLDYMLGTGGVPDNCFTEVFGPPSIGKTSVIGFGTLSSVQAAGGITAIVATEPDVDEEWMAKHGVNPDHNIIYRPDTGEEGFAILKELVYNKDVDYVLWDSLAATSSAKEQASDVPQAFGNAALNSKGMKDVLARCYKNRVGVMWINQVRDDTKATKIGSATPLKSPGGHAVHHYMKVRIQIKPGKVRHVIKVPSTIKGQGTEELMIGRELRAVIVKNKAAQELGRQAAFDFYHIEAAGYPFGFDKLTDLFNIAKVAGVIRGAGWVTHPTFPGGKLNGQDKVKNFWKENPEAAKMVQSEVAAVMAQKEKERAEIAMQGAEPDKAEAVEA